MYINMNREPQPDKGDAMTTKHIESVVWATRSGDPEWKEQLITDNQEHIQAATAWAKTNGFYNVRVSRIDLTRKPDFAACIAN